MSKNPLARTVILCSVLGATSPRAEQPQCYTLSACDVHEYAAHESSLGVLMQTVKRPPYAMYSLSGCLSLAGGPMKARAGSRAPAQLRRSSSRSSCPNRSEFRRFSRRPRVGDGIASAAARFVPLTP